MARSVVTQKLVVGTGGLVFIAMIAWLSWLRMVRFRALSETPVFTTFLACGTLVSSSEEKSGDEKDRE